MKRNQRKANPAMPFVGGLVCALGAPLLGWALVGIGPFDYYVRHYTAKVIVMAGAGFVIGLVLGAFIGKYEAANRREKEDDDE